MTAPILVNECVLGLTNNLFRLLSLIRQSDFLEPALDLGLALHQPTSKQCQGIVKSLRSDRILLDRFLQLLAIQCKVVDVSGRELAINAGCLKRIDLQDFEKSLWRFVRGVHIRRLRLALARLLRTIVLQFSQLVEDLWRNRGAVAAVLACCHRFLGCDEAVQER